MQTKFIVYTNFTQTIRSASSRVSIRILIDQQIKGLVLLLFVYKTLKCFCRCANSLAFKHFFAAHGQDQTRVV